MLDASREIVMERGAGCLTFEQVAQVSGVTRGGITYHFPTKQALLQALVQDDIEQWKELEEVQRPAGEAPETAELLAFMRSYTDENPDKRRFVTGMLGAATLDPPIIDPVREFERERLTGVEWNERNLKIELLRLAAQGLFWANLFHCPDISPELRGRLVEVLESLAREWSGDSDKNSEGNNNE
ncbi:MAG: TetR/AcrR family transcriptional regulator [Woeseiaceae bacterium]|nr:TetR/AcrR family transcriptional regulator [Woeseiaceae bacterium]